MNARSPADVQHRHRGGRQYLAQDRPNALRLDRSVGVGESRLPSASIVVGLDLAGQIW
jgi:hypothetical protein